MFATGTRDRIAFSRRKASRKLSPSAVEMNKPLLAQGLGTRTSLCPPGGDVTIRLPAYSHALGLQHGPCPCEFVQNDDRRKRGSGPAQHHRRAERLRQDQIEAAEAQKAQAQRS